MTGFGYVPVKRSALDPTKLDFISNIDRIK